ncbi:nucleotide-sugar transporter-domain-containing protein, partial [Catenaria anguillulae PL171]
MSHRRRTSHVEVPLVAAALGSAGLGSASPAANTDGLGLLAPFSSSTSPGTARSRSPLAFGGAGATNGSDTLEHISATTTGTDSASVSLLKHATTSAGAAASAAAAATDAKPPSTYAKALSLVTLTVQNSAMVLILRYSRTLAGPPYLTTTAVLLCEVFKLMLSVTLYMTTSSYPLFVTIRKLPREVFSSGWYLLSVPAILYTVQNNLQYEAVTRLDAATFAVTYQLKILTTALCSVLILRRSLSLMKWTALVILTAGVALVQMPST